MAKQKIYTVGGTVQAGGGLYIKRKADDELLELCRNGEFAFILSSRQVGKSSLMVRTAQQLEKENIRSVTIDLSAIGVNVSADEWYLGILNEIHSALSLETDIFAWWNQFAQLGPAQRLTNFFKDILLKELQDQIVLFFDEIDSTLSIPFSDDFYVAIRSVYNARSTNPDFKRLSFVLVGVATPGDLISDNKRTPFNIGHRVEISDFTLAEALPLAEGLGDQAVSVLTWILQYTGGHPYLTQRLCAYLATSQETLNEPAVATAVERLFTGEQGKQDNNLQFVRDMLSARSPDVSRVLKTYRDIRAGKNVTDDERSMTKAHLKLSGLVRSEKGVLRVRNEIYHSVFDLQWVQDNTPKNWQRVALISLSAALGILMLVTLGIFFNDFLVGTRVNQSIARFISTTSSVDRLASLAEIYNQKGIISNTDSSLQAAQLFYGLPSVKDQEGLFDIYGIEQNPHLEDDLITVIRHLYVTAANVDPEADNTGLLRSMLSALSHIPDNPDAVKLKDEITSWIAGRDQDSRTDYESALANYTKALSLNPSNHATLFERAKVYAAREQYVEALQDLDAAIAAAKQLAPVIPATATPTTSPTPSSATPSPASGQTQGPGSTPSPGTSPDGSATPIGPATATPPQGLPVTPQPIPVPRVERYESNFTTLIDVINAVRTLIENTPQLKIAMQSNGQGGYTNLQSFGLISPVDPSFATTQFSASLQSPDWVLTGGSPSRVEPIGDVQNAAATLSGQRLHVLIQLEDVPDTLTVNKESTGDNVLEYAWIIHVDLDSNGEDDYSIGLFAFKAPGAKSKTVSLTSDVNEWGQVSVSIPEKGGTGSSLESSDFAVSFNPEKNTLEFTGSRSDFQSQMQLSLSVVANTDESFRGSFINQQFLMLIENVSIGSGSGTLVRGRVARGTVKVGDPVMIIDGEDQITETKVVSLEVSQKSTNQAVVGDDVGIWIQANVSSPKSGLVLAEAGSITTYKEACVILNCPDFITATPAPTRTSGQGTVPPSSCNKAQLLSDVTIPDGTVMLTGATFIKTWRLKNVGSCAWSTSYQLVFVSGEQMGAAASQAFAQNVPVGQTVDVSVNMTAPSAPGSYRGYWMFKDASGALFGTGSQGNRPWWVDIRVSDAPPAAPTSTLIIPSQSSSVPLIETVNVSTHPDIPAGLKETFMVGPDSLEPSTTTNVVRFNGLTYWAYSYVDNRISMAIVAYDSSNNIIKEWEKTGARYLWKITVDSNSQTVIFHGQASNTIVMKWSDLVP